MNKFLDILYKILRQVIRIINRTRLTNRDFTIICQNCIGGVIYHELGLPFLSPTINLWIDEKDFYRFAANLRHYLSQELRFVELNGEHTPVAYCDDIRIHFNHYHSAEEAAEKWYARCKRVNWDNIWLICSDRWSDDPNKLPSEDDIRSFGNLDVKGRCVFAVKDYGGLDYIYHLRKDPEGDYIYPFMVDKYKWLPFWKWQFQFDYVKWLNGKK